MVDLWDENALRILSKNLNTPVWTFLKQSTSATYSFSKFDPDKKRHFLIIEGNIAENFGESLPEEGNITYDELVTEDEINKLINNLNIQFDCGIIVGGYLVKELVSLDLSGDQTKQSRVNSNQQTETKNTWRKFW